MRLIGEDEDRNVRRIAEFASRNRIPYSSLPLRSPKQRPPRAAAQSMRAVPAVIFGRNVVLTDPRRTRSRACSVSISTSTTTRRSTC
jgi:thioredoxin reductase (NADPH)